MKYLIALCACLVFAQPAFAGNILKRGAALVVMPVVCTGKAAASITVKLVKLPVYLAKGLMDSADLWAHAE